MMGCQHGAQNEVWLLLGASWTATMRHQHVPHTPLAYAAAVLVYMLDAQLGDVQQPTAMHSVQPCRKDRAL